MNKDQLHTKLAEVRIEATDSAELSVQDFIDVYGNDETRMIGKDSTNRASLLAKVYDLSVETQDTNYIFTRNI